jgi:hypothetical protein
MFFRMFDLDSNKSIGLAELTRAKDSYLFPGIDPAAILAAADPQKTGSITEEQWLQNLRSNLYACE